MTADVKSMYRTATADIFKNERNIINVSIKKQIALGAFNDFSKT